MSFFWDEMLDALAANDYESAEEIRSSADRWEGQEVRVRGRPTAYLGGYGFSMSRRRLLDILVRRATAVGAEVRFDHEVEDLSSWGDADLIVAGDGVNSRVRRLYADEFGTSVEIDANNYIWLGTHKVFDSFTFAFEETDAGWIWFHAYRFDSETSTCIIECSPDTLSGLEFDLLGPDEMMRRMEEIFGWHLDGHSLLYRTHRLAQPHWIQFRRIANQRWHHDNIVLLGDAAHTTHFTIGSGTTLALGDAMCLAEKLSEAGDLERALAAYEQERRDALLSLEREARKSTDWFEDIQDHLADDPLRFAYSLVTRRETKAARTERSWRYRLYRASQKVATLRTLRRWRNSAARELRARRRATGSARSGPARTRSRATPRATSRGPRAGKPTR